MPARLKINFFTPLPSERTSIADHSARLLAPLGQLADITVWTYQEEWDAVTCEGVTVRRFDGSTSPSLFHAADVNFYNLGNNHPYHGKIYEIARCVPGIVIIHDPNMGYFFGTIAEVAPGRRRYLKFMAQHYGPAGVSDAVKVFTGREWIQNIMMRYPMTEMALEGALGALVHHEELQQQLTTSTGLPVFYTPLSHSERNTPSTAGDKSPFKLVTFGYLGENRRLEDIARALSQFSQRDQFTWDIYGTLQVEGAADRLKKIKPNCPMTIHNFVEEDVLDRALAEANMAINLRNPTMGEASSSQLRLWEHGVPSLVSRVGWYAAQPPDTVYFVNPGQEVSEIQTYLADFLRDPASFKATGERGRAHLYRVHGTGRYAQAMVDIAALGRKLRVKRAGFDMADRATRTFVGLAGSEHLKAQVPSLRKKIHSLVRAADDHA